jgi:galactokinase
MNIASTLQEEFLKRYGLAPRIFRSPGRINLIGEHTDYNHGFVFPAAIDFHTWVAAAPREDRRIVVYSQNYRESAEIDLDSPVLSSARHWSGYVLGVALIVEQSGYRLRGSNLLVQGEVPIGSGLSSSASLEVAAGLALLADSELSIPSLELAQLCQRAENEVVGARCGIMDQFICCHAEPGTALMLDCRSLDYSTFPIAAGLSLVACNTMVKHELASGAYNQRRAECEEAVCRLAALLPNVRSLRDVTPAQLARHAQALPEVVYRRCRHVVTEDDRVNQAAACLQAGDVAGLGRLMAESHRSLRDDYEVSCAELDLMVELANQTPGIVGARMTGGGFGGCTVNLVRTSQVDGFCEFMATKYKAETGHVPDIFVTRPAGRAGEVTLPGVAVER